MKKIYKKIENWLWIVLLVAALVYFRWLVGTFHLENEKLKETQNQFDQEIETKYQRNTQLQAEIQTQLDNITQYLVNFFQLKESSDFCPFRSEAPDKK